MPQASDVFIDTSGWADVLAVRAAPCGKTEALCREVVAWGRPLLALDGEHNAVLMALGARAVRPEDAPRVWAQMRRGTDG